MGIVGAVLVAVWAKRLVIETSKVLLDREMDHPLVAEIREVVESGPEAGDTRIADLHVWRVGKGNFACALTVVTHDGQLTPDGCGPNSPSTRRSSTRRSRSTAAPATSRGNPPPSLPAQHDAARHDLLVLQRFFGGRNRHHINQLLTRPNNSRRHVERGGVPEMGPYLFRQPGQAIHEQQRLVEQGGLV